MLRDPKMITFGDPMGYLLTFGIDFDDNQILISNHFQALEMTLGVKIYLVLVINCVETPK